MTNGEVTVKLCRRIVDDPSLGEKIGYNPELRGDMAKLLALIDEAKEADPSGARYVDLMTAIDAIATIGVAVFPPKIQQIAIYALQNMDTLTEVSKQILRDAGEEIPEDVPLVMAPMPKEVQ